MARLPFPRRHDGWLDDTNAYIDGELRAPGAARFEAHLRGCAVCRERVDQLRQVRLLVASLPEVAAPRSFRLTPAMVAVPAPAALLPAPRSRFAMRTAQFAAGFAVVALLAVVTIDVTSSNSRDQNVATLADLSSGSAPRPASAAESSSNKGAPIQDATGASPGAAPQIGRTSGASGPGGVSGQQTDGGLNSTAVAAGGAPLEAGGGLAPGTSAVPGAASSRDESHDGWRRPAELALGAFALAALAAAATLTLRNRRSRNA